jgi:hypothetical protein
MARPLAKNKTTRITVSFSAQATQWIEKEADVRTISQADLIRRIVDEARGVSFLQPRRRGA